MEDLVSKEYYNMAASLDDNPAKYGEAKKMYEKSLSLNPNNAEAHYRYARLVYKFNKDFETARVHYEIALTQNPNHAYAHNNLAALLQMHYGNIESAKSHYEAAVTINPNDEIAQKNYAILLQEDFSKYAEAQKHYEAALTINPQNADTHARYAFLLQECLGNYSAAKKHYEQALSLNSQNASTHINYAVLLEMHFYDFEAAKEHYEIAVRIEPGSEHVQFNYALFLNNQGDYQEAKKHYQDALAINPLSEATQHNYSILLCQHFQEYAEARQHFEDTLDINPDNANANYNYAILLYQYFADDSNLSEKHFKKAISLDPGNERFYCGLADLLSDKRLFSEAKQNYENSLEVNPNYEPAHIGYAELLYKYSTFFAEAGDHYLRALSLNPQNARSLNGYFDLIMLELRSQLSDGNASTIRYPKTVDEFLISDFGTFFNLQEADTEMINNQTRIHYKTGGFQEFIDIIITISGSNEISSAKLSIDRNWLDMPAIGRFGIDIIKSFIEYFKAGPFMEPLIDTIWNWERDGEETYWADERREVQLSNPSLVNAFAVIAEKLDYCFIINDNVVYGFGNELDNKTKSKNLVINIGYVLRKELLGKDLDHNMQIEDVRTFKEFYPDRKSRSQLHYNFAHRFLPDYIHKNPLTFFGLFFKNNNSLEMNPNTFIQSCWEVEARKFGFNEEQKDDRLQIISDLSIWVQEVEGYPVVFVKMPEPEKSPEAYYIAAVLNIQVTTFENYSGTNAEPRVFTLEKTIKTRELHKETTSTLTGILCEWTKEGVHKNFGEEIPVNKESFIREIASFLK